MSVLCKHGRRLTGRCGLFLRIEAGQNYGEGDHEDGVRVDGCCDLVGWVRFRHLRERSVGGVWCKGGEEDR